MPPSGACFAEGDESLSLALLKAGTEASAGWEGCDGHTLLGAAAEGGNHELVPAVLESGDSEELDKVSGKEGMTPLHHAIARGHTDAARTLMLAAAAVRLVDGRDRSALHYAVEGGYLQLTENAIIGEAGPDSKDIDGNTPLHLAARHDDQAFVGALLRRGASVGAANKKGQHPFQVAVEHGRVAVAEALLKAGADPNVFYDEFHPPLYLARYNLSMTRILLEHGADVKPLMMSATLRCTWRWKMPKTTKGGKGRAGKAKARRGRGRGGGSAPGGPTKVDVLTRVVELEDYATFRTIIGFL
eukprot:g16772.t1